MIKYHPQARLVGLHMPLSDQKFAERYEGEVDRSRVGDLVTKPARYDDETRRTGVVQQRPYLPPSSTIDPGFGGIKASLFHPTLYACAQEKSKDNEKEQSYNELISRRIPLCIASKRFGDSRQRPLTHTETSSLHIALFSSRSIWVGISQTSIDADVELLI